MRRAAYLLVILVLGVLTVSAQQTSTAVTSENLNLRAGAGRDHPTIGAVAVNTTVSLEARNDDASWTLVRAGDARGWLAAAYLRVNDGAAISSLPVSAEQMPAVTYDLMDRVRATSVVPTNIGRAGAIFQQGLAAGNNPQRFSKVGDCQSITQFFLADFDQGAYTLGNHANLQATIDHFAGSWARSSASVNNGFNIYSTLDPSWAGVGCLAGESPIECEYRLWQPSFVIISLEVTSGIQASGYEWALRENLDFWIERGVVPIVATKADNREGDWSVNAAIARTAWEYNVPLWNFLMATQPLANFGLTDGFHLTFASNDFSNPTNLATGWTQRNLTALQTLHNVRLGVGAG